MAWAQRIRSSIPLFHRVSSTQRYRSTSAKVPPKNYNVKVQYSLIIPFLGFPHGCSNFRVYGLLQNCMSLAKISKVHHGYRNVCSASELAAKKCVPCNSSAIRPMDEELANGLMTKVPDWKLVNEGGKLKLIRSWKVKTFTKGLEFFQAIADVAEKEGHHPDLHLVGWNNVTVEIWTHSIGGLTENDFILAAKISNLDLAPLLRIKPSK